tara:strand:+ start:376 stop:570 length:195 start_codon:yes stop_codon:yes gene_type:complete
MTKDEMISILMGSYTPSGVEKWFDRPRSWLQGKTPQEVIDSGDVELLGRIINHLEGLQGPGLAT